LCREFLCLWRSDDAVPDEWKPERSKIVLVVNKGDGNIFAHVDPGAPHAWRKAPFHDQLRHKARDLLAEDRYLILVVGTVASLILPEETIPIGKITPGIRFVVQKNVGPAGPTYTVETRSDVGANA
jgi:hypothetical protein